ncbi:MAG: DUF1499 domain-containing protein, partial [Desulfobulbus sp.]|nr:DUF1499 domain-containing protein [Desulfobulbus sp.]
MKTNRTPWLWKIELIAFGVSILAIFAFRMQLLGWRPALLSVATTLSAVVLIGFLSLMILFAKLRSGRAQGASRHCLLAVLLSLPVLIGLLLLGMRGAKAPPIHDITTDLANPPAFTVAATQRRPGDNSALYPGAAIGEQQQQAYPDLAPIKTPLTPDLAYTRAIAIAHALGWQVVSQNLANGTIEATDRSLVFGFIDDIALRITVEGNGSRIDLRSASRAGVSDLGV